MAKKLAPPLALVAGASGNIGNHVVRQLQDQGIRVRALVRNPAQLSSAVAALATEPRSTQKLASRMVLAVAPSV